MQGLTQYRSECCFDSGRNSLLLSLKPPSRGCPMSSKDRKTPKRLFSFDNLKASSSRRSSSEGSPATTSSHGRGISRGNILNGVPESDSPLEYDPSFQDPFASRPASPASFAKLERPPTRPKTPDGQRSGSPMRGWGTLRQHVLPPSRTSTPPIPVRGHASQPSNSSASSKSSRFPRLGFRQVVDNARQAYDTRKIAEEIMRTCHAIRYSAEGAKRDGNSVMGPGSSTTLVNTGATKKRPASQSTQVAGTTSIASLHQLLYTYSVSDTMAVPVHLPHENHILSTLLTPFQMPSASGKWEEERAFAVESFELLLKGWLPQDEVRNSTIT